MLNLGFPLVLGNLSKTWILHLVSYERHLWWSNLRLLSSSAKTDVSEVRSSTGSSPKPEDIPLKNMRNFSIIAHVDHGKSTLADRLLEMTGTLKATPDNKQVLDRLQVERERGITVKAQTASLFYRHNDEDYLLNLIDTPGHVDFSNEVSRSLAACQGVILLVDANQGVQAQTVANFYLAFGQELAILPVLNKIDLKNAKPQQVKDQLFNLFTIDPDDVLMISAKLGTGVESVLSALVQRVPPPPGSVDAPWRALVFDSWYDRHRGAIAVVYVRDGTVRVGDEVVSAHNKKVYTVRALGLLRPHEEPSVALSAGQVGFIVCNMRSVSEAHIGDTLSLRAHPVEPLPGFHSARPMVYAGVYPFDQSQHVTLRGAIEKLALNDPAASVTVDSSPALGQGWRVGFLGLLHLEVFSQRLEQEYGAEVVMTAPSVPYKVKIAGSKKNVSMYGSDELTVSDPSKMPDPSFIKEIAEPMVMGIIITPEEYMFKLVGECMERRGTQESSTTIGDDRVMLRFLLPLNEIIIDFHDRIKSITSGFASFDYEDHGYQVSDLVKVDILLNGIPVDALSFIVHVTKATTASKHICAKLAEIIPRQMVHIAIQAAIGSKILARENLKAFRKDVTAKLYGGDVTRRMKLLKQQSEGKKKMKSVANINIPRDTFIEVLKR